jgi:hypothetical protein
MLLLLTILSVVALWALLALLIFGLLLILKPLESIRTSLQKITMGVRAIERQTLPLGVHADALRETFAEAGSSVNVSAEHLASVALALEAASPHLRARP